MMPSFWRDVRYGLRLLVRSPQLSAMAVLTFALGVGANSAVFSVVNAALLRPLPYADSERLVVVLETDAAQAGRELPVAPADFLDWKQQGDRAFEAVTGYHPWRHTLIGRGEPTPMATGVVDADFFRVLGVSPALGRTFRADEIHSAGELLVILSDDLWRERFNADPAAVGGEVTLDDLVYTVVGVMPPGFDFPSDARLWRPIHLGADSARRDFQYLRVLGRLRPEATLRTASEVLETIGQRLETEYPETNRGRGVVIHGLTEQIVGEVRPALLILLGAVALVLAVACVNLASLLLARSASRRSELAMRTALGASRGRLVQQFLGESLVIAAIGGALGLAIAVWGARLLVRLSPQPIPGVERGLLDGRVLLFTFAVALVTGVLSGLLPAFRGRRADLGDRLQGAGRSSDRALPRLRAGLVVGEIAIATVLTVAAGLMVQTFLRLRSVDPGFTPRGVLAAQVSLPPTSYPELTQTATFGERLLERLRALPGVESAGLALVLPLSNGMVVDNRFEIEGRPAPPGEERSAFMRPISDGYLETLGIDVVFGRALSSRDDRTAPGVVMINEAAARRFWPDRNPLGDRLIMGAMLGGLGAVDETPREIVGVLRDVKHSALDSESQPAVYFSIPQGTWRHLQVVARTSGDPLALAGGVRAAVWALDDRLPVSNVQPLTDLVGQAVGQERFSMLLLSAFAVLALLLAAAGIYGVVSYVVQARSHEVGVRMALGAQRTDVVRMIVRQVLPLAALGVILGILGALGSTRWLASELYGVQAVDPPTFLVVVGSLGVLALLAAYLPARRATRVDPAQTLR